MPFEGRGTRRIVDNPGDTSESFPLQSSFPLEEPRVILIAPAETTPAVPPSGVSPRERKRPVVADRAQISSNYAGRVLQRSAFRSLVGRRRTPGSAISSVLNGLRTMPPPPRRPEPEVARDAGAAT